MNRTSYYKAPRSVDPRTQDVTEWLEYFAGDRCGDGAGRAWDSPLACQAPQPDWGRTGGDPGHFVVHSDGDCWAHPAARHDL
jgi:hypothetical protein